MTDNKDKDKDMMNEGSDDKDGKRGLFGGINAWLNDAIQTGRAPERKLQIPESAVAEPVVAAKTAPEKASGRPAVPAAPVTMATSAAVPGKMVIPEGVTIQGSLTGGPDTEISGQIQGDVKVEGRLFLGPSARVTGKVHAGSCRIDGQVEGPLDCLDDVELGKSGRLNAGITAGKRISIAGQVYGNIETTGAVRLVAGAVMNGDIQTRGLLIEEGAVFNGSCSMKTKAPAGNELKESKEV